MAQSWTSKFLVLLTSYFQINHLFSLSDYYTLSDGYSNFKGYVNSAATCAKNSFLRVSNVSHKSIFSRTPGLMLLLFKKQSKNALVDQS